MKVASLARLLDVAAAEASFTDFDIAFRFRAVLRLSLSELSLSQLSLAGKSSFIVPLKGGGLYRVPLISAQSRGHIAMM